ncbi:hypothetical protein [Tenacibaculum ovolyticum]|uniref:hypothetical protein n=1 Tax=Tenacibaculum ovolyticum TaxID=104270 RepID=UPI001F1C00AF|nr:hypothetical protein [Tenacibaculum ovolyticum]
MSVFKLSKVISILNLGKALNKAEQKQINGGDCVNYDPDSGTSTRGACDKNSIYSVEIDE